MCNTLKYYPIIRKQEERLKFLKQKPCNVRIYNKSSLKENKMDDFSVGDTVKEKSGCCQ